MNKLHLMDCMEGMKEFPDNYFDLSIIDPPYGFEIKKDFYKVVNEWFERIQLRNKEIDEFGFAKTEINKKEQSLF